MLNLFIGIIIGVVFQNILLRLFNIGWKALEKQVDNLDDQVKK